MEIQTTSNAKVQSTVLVYGPSKSGKTSLAKTCPDCIIADVDMGLSSLREMDIPYVPIRKTEDILEFLEAAKRNFDYPEGSGFKTIIIDDLTEIGSLWLRLNKNGYKNLMQAYGALADWTLELIHGFRNLSEQGFNIVFICKEEKIKDHTTGGLIWSPAFPGQAIQNMLDYLVGEVYHMEQWIDPADESQQKHRVLRTVRSPQIAAGSRFGKFGELEFADLGSMFDRMKNLG